MTHIIRIKKDAPRRLVFEIENGGVLLARSAPYTSICKLEAGLSVLTAAAGTARHAGIDTDGKTTWVRPEGRRTRVALDGRLPADFVARLLMGMPSAMVIDERPPSERRADLSGLLCDLTH